MKLTYTSQKINLEKKNGDFLHFSFPLAETASVSGRSLFCERKTSLPSRDPCPPSFAAFGLKHILTVSAFMPCGISDCFFIIAGLFVNVYCSKKISPPKKLQKFLYIFCIFLYIFSLSAKKTKILHPGAEKFRSLSYNERNFSAAEQPFWSRVRESNPP